MHLECRKVMRPGGVIVVANKDREIEEIRAAIFCGMFIA